MVASSAFLVSAHLATATLQQVVLSAIRPEGLDVDRIDFAEGGGDVDLQLAVPFLPGMDEVAVDAARLALHGVDVERAIDGWHTVSGPGGNGMFVCLDVAAPLRQLVIAEPALTESTFLVVRAATLDSSGRPTAGAPLAASKAFTSGPMLPPPLAALTVSGTGTGRLTLRLATTSGQAWLVQVATGDSLDQLDASAGSPQVFSVTVLPAPADLSLVLQAGDGAAEQALWQHPGPLLAVAADQVADFTPAVGRRLNQALSSLNTASSAGPALSLPLRFHSAGAGTLGVRERRLDVSYRAHLAATTGPVKLALDGGWRDFGLSAPARPPATSELRLTAKHRGLVVNAGSGVPPAQLPVGGIRIRADRSAAARLSWQAVSASGPLAQVRLLAAAVGEAELVVELRRDAGGGPGELLAPAMVTRLARGATADWVSLAPAAPIPISGSAMVWLTARTNRGEVLWFGTPTASGSDPAAAGTLVRVSADGGSSWGEPEGALAPPAMVVAQLVEAVDPAAQPPPVVQLRAGETPLGALILTAGAAPAEYVGPQPPVLPDGLLGLIGAPGGMPRREVSLALWSSALMDLTVTALTCSYRP